MKKLLFTGYLCVMKQFIVLAILCNLCIPYVSADDAILNNPTQTVSVFKDAINRLQPSYETVWDVNNGDFSQGLSASLYNFTSQQIPIASVRLGASTGMALYGGGSLDLPGLTQRFIPTTIKGVATTSPLNVVWSFLGKYARVGVVSGYSWDHDDPVIGITAGAALTF